MQVTVYSDKTGAVLLVQAKIKQATSKCRYLPDQVQIRRQIGAENSRHPPQLRPNFGGITRSSHNPRPAINLRKKWQLQGPVFGTKQNGIQPHSTGNAVNFAVKEGYNEEKVSTQDAVTSAREVALIYVIFGTPN